MLMVQIWDITNKKSEAFRVSVYFALFSVEYDIFI